MVDVYLEVGQRRVFAAAYDWPGWCRSAKTEEAALETLEAYRRRYANAVGKRVTGALTVVERIEGGGATDFGAPEKSTARDGEPLDSKAARRLAELVEASWRYFDGVVAAAPASLRKGPRGGGRDRDKIVEHVTGAELAYAAKFGLRRADYSRAALAEAIAAGSPGKWPVRYAARRIAWHVLDHAWEIEDRSE